MIWFALFMAPATLLVAGDKFDWDELGANAAWALLALPWLWVVWKLLHGSWFLLAGIVLSLVVMTIYWMAAGTTSSEPWVLLLVPPACGFLLRGILGPSGVVDLDGREALETTSNGGAWNAGPCNDRLVLAGHPRNYFRPGDA